MINPQTNSEIFDQIHNIFEEKPIKTDNFSSFTYENLDYITSPSKRIPIKKKMIVDPSSSHFSQVEVSAYNSTIRNDTFQKDTITLALPFDDSMQGG